jgi:hypothetical protein
MPRVLEEDDDRGYQYLDRIPALCPNGMGNNDPYEGGHNIPTPDGSDVGNFVQETRD